MSGAPRVLAGGTLVLAAGLAMGALTRVPFPASPDRAELRLAWRLRVPRVEHCRTPTPEELAELPVHMRQTEICEGRPGRYRLEVAVDGRIAHRSTVEAAGVRGDRPLYVFQALPLEPGAHRLRVTFERTDLAGDSAAPGAGASSAAGEIQAPGGPGSDVPDRLVLDRRVRAGTHDVLLVTYDPDARALELRGQEDR